MRTGNINVQVLLAQAQAKLSGKTLSDTTQKAASSTTTSDVEKLSEISPVLAQVHQRIAAQSQTASASLSALGQFKSDLFNLGTTAKNLASLTAASTPQAVQSSVEKMVAAYNATLKSGDAMGSSGGDGSAGTSRAQRELRAAVDGRGTPSAELSKMGVVRKPDGSLSLDTIALAKALSADQGGALAALTRMAERVSGVATQTLAEDSGLSSSMTRLGNRAQALKDQQAAVMRTATELAELDTSASTSSWSAMALAAYRKV